MITPDVFLFWFLAAVAVISAIVVVAILNPIFSALALAMTLVTVSALFVTLNAYFLAGVQLIVYAGAVMVLFVMVIMLFDLRHELQAFARGKVSGVIKLGSVGMLAGLVMGAIFMSSQGLLSSSVTPDAQALQADNTKTLGKLLFSQYLFGFEALGVLLLVVAVGAVALARSKGGTHAKH